MCLLDLYLWGRRGLEGGGAIGIACNFFGGLESKSSRKKGGSIETRNSLWITIEAQILFKEERQGLFKLHVPFGWGWVVSVWRKNGAISKRRDFLWNRKITCEEASQNLLKSCLSFGGVWRVLIKNKWEGNKKMRLYGEIWGNAVWMGLVKVLWDSSCVTVLQKWSLSKCGSLLRGEVGWDRFAYWLQRHQWLLLPLLFLEPLLWVVLIYA